MFWILELRFFALFEGWNWPKSQNSGTSKRQKWYFLYYYELQNWFHVKSKWHKNSSITTMCNVNQHTVWQFEEFPVTRILREINYDVSRSLKYANYAMRMQNCSKSQKWSKLKKGGCEEAKNCPLPKNSSWNQLLNNFFRKTACLTKLLPNNFYTVIRQLKHQALISKLHQG